MVGRGPSGDLLHHGKIVEVPSFVHGKFLIGIILPLDGPRRRWSMPGDGHFGPQPSFFNRIKSNRVLLSCGLKHVLTQESRLKSD